MKTIKTKEKAMKRMEEIIVKMERLHELRKIEDRKNDWGNKSQNIINNYDLEIIKLEDEFSELERKFF